MFKGVLTWSPLLNDYRIRRASTGGTNCARYCYSVWLRHLVILDRCGFSVAGTRVGELGPGDSIGTGLAALLSGAAKYVGLDVVPFSANANLARVYQDLIHMFRGEEPIPDDGEFPRVQPRLDSYQFPRHLIDQEHFARKVAAIRTDLKAQPTEGQYVSYRAPWLSRADLEPASLDLIFSQAVLEHVDNLQETYAAMSAWLKAGGYASHVIDFRSHGLSPFWNGHWAYSDREWRLVRGRREFLLNREPISTHLSCAQKAGFEIVFLQPDYGSYGLETRALSPRFRVLKTDDLGISGAVLILKKLTC